MNKALILAGTKLSNIIYNLQQDESLPLHVRNSMQECYKEWDEAVKEHSQQSSSFTLYKNGTPIHKETK